MKIDRVSTVTRVRARPGERARAGAPGGFVAALSPGESPAASSVNGTGTIGRVEALLAVQEVTNDPETPGGGRRRGEVLLDHLEDLRVALLGGRLPVAMVERLAALVAQRRDRVDDPDLAAVLDDIELRAAVELAKLGR